MSLCACPQNREWETGQRHYGLIGNIGLQAANCGSSEAAEFSSLGCSLASLSELSGTPGFKNSPLCGYPSVNIEGLLSEMYREHSARHKAVA